MNNYRITREGDDDSPTMSLCVERNVKAKTRATNVLKKFATVFKFMLLTFAIDPLLPINLT